MKFYLDKRVFLLAGSLLTANMTFADGTLTSTATATATVLNSIGISSGLTAINLGVIDFTDNALNTGTGTFTVKANSLRTSYDVWISVPAANIDTANHVYVARATDDSGLPLNVSLTGNSGVNAVNANPAVLQTGAPSTAHPTTGLKADGDGIAGTNRNGTVYTVTLTENDSVLASYPDIPAGTYTMQLTANIAQN